MPIKAKEALPVVELAEVLSDLPQVTDYIRLPNFCEKLELSVTTLICLFEMHGHLPHPKTILDQLKLTEKETESVRERSRILMLHLCGGSRYDVHRCFVGCRKKTDDNMKGIRVKYGVPPTRGTQVTFASTQSYEKTFRVIYSLSSSDQMQNTPDHQDFDVGRRFTFQSAWKSPPQPRSNINPKYDTAENSKMSKNQELRTSTASRRIGATIYTPMFAAPPRASIGGPAFACNFHQRVQRSLTDTQDRNVVRGASEWMPW